MNFQKCPECGGPCKMEWSGLDLVSNTGDETLASKHYISLAVSPKFEILVIALSMAHPDSNILPFIKKAQELVKAKGE